MRWALPLPADGLRGIRDSHGDCRGLTHEPFPCQDTRSNPLKTFFSLKLQNFISKLFRTSKNLIEMMETFPSARLQPPGHTSRHRCAGTRDRKGPPTAPLTSASLPHRPLPPHGPGPGGARVRSAWGPGRCRRAAPSREGSESTPGTTAACVLTAERAGRSGRAAPGRRLAPEAPPGRDDSSQLPVRPAVRGPREGVGAFPGQVARRACARDGPGRWAVAGRLSGRGGCCPQRSWAPPGAAALPGDQGGDAGSALAEPSAHIPHRQLQGVAAGAPIPGSGLRPRRLRPRSGAGSPGPAGKVTPQSFTPHVTRFLAR